VQRSTIKDVAKRAKVSLKTVSRVINNEPAVQARTRERVLRDYALELLKALAPQLDRRDLRRVLEGNAEPAWPTPPSWTELSQTITS